MLLDILEKNISKEYDTNGVDYKELEKTKKYTSDENYFFFISKISDGGYFHDYALHIYGYNTTRDFNCISIVNNVLKTEFGDIFNGLYSFGEDVFGNQFVFSKEGILFFNIETGERKLVANTFSDWLKVLNQDILYFSGKNFSSYLKESVGTRLCPKIPFVIGGEYDFENLYVSSFPKYISLNANIAKQIYNLPDGTNIKIELSD